MFGILLLVILVTLIITLSTILMINYTSNFCNSSVITVPTPEEQQIENDKFLKSYNLIKKLEEKLNKDKIPLTWNPNNTLESMKLEPCLSNIDGNAGPGRLTCYSAPAWWYPNNAYKAENFRSVYYGDYNNPIYNYLGNAQEMFWDFKSVENTFSEI